MPELFSIESLMALLALTSLEVVLGIDNIVFIAILTGRVEKARQASARRLGLLVAMVTRILLLFAITWIMGLTKPLLNLWSVEISGRSLILMAGGLFLLAKATHEIHAQIEHSQKQESGAKASSSFWAVVAQIGLIDIVFSLDSVITAVGMARHLYIMVAAVVLAVGIMIIFAGPVSRFIEQHPTMRILALSFLILVGVMLVAESLGQHLDRGYVYFAMAFSLVVEILNMRMRKKNNGALGRNQPPDGLKA